MNAATPSPDSQSPQNLREHAGGGDFRAGAGAGDRERHAVVALGADHDHVFARADAGERMVGADARDSGTGARAIESRRIDESLTTLFGLGDARAPRVIEWSQRGGVALD